ncbi:hypothetical protein HK100_012428 [Physocladia obscura]|uniref:2-aminomuconate deaminase n=1 Tax=Physocladia obscura TaxID=109957 RepID=A0AAD5XFX1_9FUNG|nr:hypothetical protein HK100_012428 [Physocladia obscura]
MSSQSQPPIPKPNGEAVVVKDRAGALANYPHARIAGGFVFVSGISSRRTDGTWAGVHTNNDGSFVLDIKQQTQAVLENIQAILRQAGVELANLVDLTVFLIDMVNYNDFNDVYNTFFPIAELGPARTTVAVKQLPNPRLLIEIKAVALLPQS